MNGSNIEKRKMLKFDEKIELTAKKFLHNSRFLN